MPAVSIITPCFNSERFVGQTIESVKRQTFPDWEQIIVDDGSTDASRQVIASQVKKEPRCRLVSQSNRGVSAARNAGFRASSEDSRYLLFLDADDSLEPEMLTVLVNYLEDHPEVGLARSEYRFINTEGNFIERSESKGRFIPRGLWVGELPPDVSETPFVSVFNMCAIIPSISLIRRSIFEQTPGFDETFGHHHEDIDLIFHIALRSQIHYVPQPLVRRRCHPGQNTADSPRFRAFAFEQQRKLYAKWLSANGLTDKERALIREAWHFRQGRLEPYWAFESSRRFLNEGDFLKAGRYFLGGLKRYLFSFLPGAIKNEV